MNGTENRTAFIFTGGVGFCAEKMTDIPCDGDLIIAADSGCKTLCEYKKIIKELSPDIILGDMDSCEKEKCLSDFPNASFIGFCAEKDDTDTALAVDEALARGCNRIILVCGLGGRIDHTLALVFLSEYIESKGARAIITDGKNRAYIAKPTNTVHRCERKYVSLVPLDTAIYDVSMSGFKYPLNVPILERSRFVSISNELAQDKDEGIISVGCGKALIIETFD